MNIKLITVFIGMLLGNLIVQSFNPTPNWGVAIERSYFQGMALLTYWFCEAFLWKELG